VAGTLNSRVPVLCLALYPSECKPHRSHQASDGNEARREKRRASSELYGSEHANRLRLRTPVALSDLELDPLPLLEAAVAIREDG
jgi:hypothetical protein